MSEVKDTATPSDARKPETVSVPNVSTDLLQVRHRTSYRYAKPVRFGPHRGMLRPHESNDLRLLSLEISVSPDSVIHWVHDVFSNSITVMEFTEPADHLEVTAVFSVVRSTIHEPAFPIEPFAQTFPFEYPADQQIDLQALITPEYDHPGKNVRNWVQEFPDTASGETLGTLQALNSAIHSRFDYQHREEPGVQAPRETLAIGCGSCRDFAVLMLEAVRQLGLAARFVTGYLYDPFTDQAPSRDSSLSLSGTGATHAWVQVFLPGAGWIDFDPTNGLVASGNLIRTGVARTPAQAAPLHGSYIGDADDFISLDVDVEVTALAPTIYK